MAGSGSGKGTSGANQRQNTRHKAKYLAYRNNDTREKNKAYKLIRHLERHPACKTGITALENLPAFCVKFARERLSKARKKSNIGAWRDLIPTSN